MTKNFTKVVFLALILIFATMSRAQSNPYEQVQTIDGTLHAGNLGLDIARSDNILVVSERGGDDWFGKIHVYTKEGAQWVYRDSATGDEQYASYGPVAISGNLIVVGAPETTIGGVENRGRVYIYTFENNVLTLHQKIDGTGSITSRFGAAVAVENTILAVGERSPSQVYIYNFNGSTANQRMVIDTEIPARLILKNNILAVGARFGGVNGAGSVQLFEINGTNSNLLTSLYGEADADNFGQNIGFDGNILAVGAPAAKVNGVQYAGSGYIYSFDGTNTTLLGKFNDSDIVQQYGLGVAVEGNTVAFGAPVEERVQIFTIDGSNVELEQTILGMPSSSFGTSIDLNQQELIISAHTTKTNFNSAGRIYIYSNQGDCYIDVPDSVNENESFNATVTCSEVDEAVYGFDFAHSIDPSSPPITPQSTTYNAGDIFANAGSNTLTLINDLNDGYAVTLRDPEPPVSISGTATLGTVTYDTDLPGTAILNLESLILGNDIGQAISATYSATTSIEIVDLPIAAVSGTATRETGADTGVDITLTIDAVAPISPTSTAGIFYYAYPEIVAVDGLLEADAPGHLYCSQQLNLIDEVVNPLPLITLLAGDVNDDSEINITDGAIIVSARIGDPVDPTYTPDLNEDGLINILDLIHVGRNFGKQQPNLCISS